MVFLKEFLKMLILKKIAQPKVFEKLPYPVCKELINLYVFAMVLSGLLEFVCTINWLNILIVI